MEPKDVMRIPTMKSLQTLLDMLNLTDRQRQIFLLKFSRGWRNIDIAEELKVSQDTVGDDFKIITEKLKSIREDYLKTLDDSITLC